MVHTRYRQPGGEDFVAQAESDMLREAGVEVRALNFTNDISPQSGRLEELKLLVESSWSASSARRVREQISEFRPDVLHVHNFWMQASPSVHHQASAMGVGTVQTLHNFRLLCTNAQLLRNGRVCEDCVGKIPWRGVIRRCYRNSFVASGAVGAMIATNRIRGTWDNDVDAFIALTSHAREKFIAGGLPADRIFVKPNFGPPLSCESSRPSSSNHFLFLGRLSAEKGVGILLQAWKLAGLRGFRLRIVGDGPERDALQKQAAALDLGGEQVEFTGFVERYRMGEQIAGSRCLILPSIWYEGFPVTILEAASMGRPCIVSAIGALPQLVGEGATGLTFPAGDASALAKVIRGMAEDDDLTDRLGAAARESYMQLYTPAQNLPALLDIYRFAIERKRARKKRNAGDVPLS